ncbi:hypothetical protein [Thermosediminibacter litoriperuensis]|uniref:Uncharacterized protein n=1 Tax=Thermosediminibacter litoriperuensis TaxID=291989 RepID=A0A5S5APT3_9FIRM|nr:hypothetical protein [Thermosediminibacter litoriperuensis]TYP53328.1 hypothetical protein LZ11_01570 [Thermosediminibacter litoriperuensis]
MRTFLVENLSTNLPVSMDMTCRAVVCNKVEGGYIIDINGEKIFARTGLLFAEGQTVTLKPVRFFENQVVFKVLNRQDKASGQTQTAAPTAGDFLSLLTLSKLNIPITRNRLKILSRFIEQLLEEIDRPGENPARSERAQFREPGSLRNNSVEETTGAVTRESTEPTTSALIAVRVLNAAHANLKDVQVAFFSLNHPFFGNILLKVKKRREEGPDSLPVTLSFLVNAASLGRILVNLTYSKGVIGGSLVFEDREKLDIARKRYENIKEKVSFSRVIESLSWQWHRIAADKFLLEDLDALGVNSGVDVTV